MKRSLYLTLLVVALLVLALGGWAVQAVRYGLGGPRRALATA